jgi:hypothetical protein
MGNALVCFEHGQWDSHHNVQARYKPAAAPKQDMTQPLSHYFISRYGISTHARQSYVGQKAQRATCCLGAF